MPRAKKTVHLWGNWSEEELQRAFDKIKFANCCFKGTWNSLTNTKGLFDFFINQNLLISEVGVIAYRMALLHTG